MQISRLFEIVYLLMNKKRMTADELALHFEVSKRTILRSVDALTMAGIPIYTMQGKGGGIFIHDDFILNKALISEKEQKQILFSLQSMVATEFADTSQVLARLRSFFSGSSKEWVEVDFSRWGHSEKDNAKFELLKACILDEQAVSFDYLSPYGESKGRKAYPLMLSFKSKAWYLQAFCLAENEHRVFKFNRINNIVALNESFSNASYEIPPIKTLEEQEAPDFIYIKILIAQNAKYRIYDEFAEGDIKVNADGSLTLRTTLGPWIYDYILSYGTAIEILEPAHIRNELLKRIEKIKSKYLS